MGAKFLTSLANLYVGWWEERSLFCHSNPFTKAIKWYGRFIDDLILIWDSDLEDVLNLLVYALPMTTT